MRNFWIILTVSLALLSAIQAVPKPDPEPASSQVYRLANFGRKRNPIELRQASEIADNAANDEDSSNTKKKTDASTGRLFFKKFLASSLFSSGNQQPVIPIIITGAGNTGTTGTTTSPTVTITSTGSIPTASGTITTSPVTTPRENEENDDAPNKAEISVEDLQAALAANAQDYVVTDQQIREPAEGDALKQQDQKINVRGGNSNAGQIISVRIPPKYRRYFKNGQRVKLNTNNNRPGKRRLVTKRVVKNRRRNGRNKNRRNRLG